jgi:hypothetical protein
MVDTGTRGGNAPVGDAIGISSASVLAAPCGCRKRKKERVTKK